MSEPTRNLLDPLPELLSLLQRIRFAPFSDEIRARAGQIKEQQAALRWSDGPAAWRPTYEAALALGEEAVALCGATSGAAVKVGPTGPTGPTGPSEDEIQAAIAVAEGVLDHEREEWPHRLKEQFDLACQGVEQAIKAQFEQAGGEGALSTPMIEVSEKDRLVFFRVSQEFLDQLENFFRATARKWLGKVEELVPVFLSRKLTEPLRLLAAGGVAMDLSLPPGALKPPIGRFVAPPEIRREAQGKMGGFLAAYREAMGVAAVGSAIARPAGALVGGFVAIPAVIFATFQAKDFQHRTEARMMLDARDAFSRHIIEGMGRRLGDFRQGLLSKIQSVLRAHRAELRRKLSGLRVRSGVADARRLLVATPLAPLSATALDEVTSRLLPALDARLTELRRR
jgi:hypothetical protein